MYIIVVNQYDEISYDMAAFRLLISQPFEVPSFASSFSASLELVAQHSKVPIALKLVSVATQFKFKSLFNFFDRDVSSSVFVSDVAENASNTTCRFTRRVIVKSGV